MDEKLTRISTSPDSMISELGSSSFSMSILPPLRSSHTMTNFDDFHSSRWESTHNDDFNKATYLVNDFLTNRNIASSSITDVLISPMSRLSTSSSVMSFNSLNNSKTNPSTSTMTNSNENLDFFSSASSFLPLPTPTSSSTMSTMIDNDLQRVPHSWMLVSPSSSSTSPTYGAQSTSAQVVQSTGRPHSMPSWRGYLPMKFESMTIDHYQMTSHFSQKVFLGGIPAELTEAELLLVLRKFGKCNIKWPKNDGLSQNMPGFCHVVFRESRSVCELLKHCTRQQRSTIDYFLHIHMTTPSISTGLPIRTNRLKPIQVVPWNIKDNVYVMQQMDISSGDVTFKDWSRTIFVSPLHGKMTAFSLATIMANVFGPVSMAQINTDKYGYPTGTGTVLFADSHSYMRAVAAGAIDIKCDCFHKLLDIDPFLRENEPCAFCPSSADLFCRNFHCLRSFCKQCWVNKHGPKPLADHQPATRRQQPLPHL